MNTQPNPAKTNPFVNAVWHSFKLRGLKFLAFPDGNGNVTVIGEQGQNLGSYYSLKSFEGFLKDNKTDVLGYCRLSITHCIVPPAYEEKINQVQA